MIVDREIDLTVEHKFYVSPWFKDRHNENAKRKISTGKFSDGKRAFIDIDATLGEKIARRAEIPWIRKQSDIHSAFDMRQSKVAVHADDETSREFCCTVRSTSSNTLLFFGEHADRYMRPELVEEIFMETVGYIPFTAVTRCMRCGQWVLAPHNTIPYACSSCEDNSYFRLPWLRSLEERRVGF